MFKKPKQLMLLLGAVVLVTSVGFGTVWSYIRTAHTQLGETVRDTVPISFELKRLEQMTGDLIPEIRANQKVAAQLDVEIEYLEREIGSMEESQEKRRAQRGPCFPRFRPHHRRTQALPWQPHRTRIGYGRWAVLGQMSAR